MDVKFWANMALCCLMLVFFMSSVQAISASSSVEELLQPTIEISEETKELLKHVELIRFGIRLKKDKNMVDAIFNLKNGSEHDIANISIICNVKDKADKYLGQQKWLIAETIEKSSEKTLLRENSKMFFPKKANKVKCQITDMDVIRGAGVKANKPDGAAASHGDVESKKSPANNH